MRIEPCVVERKNQFIFENKITFDVSPLIRPRYRFELKKCLTNLNQILKVYIILLTKNNICLFDLQMQTFNKTGVVAFLHPC